MVHRFWASARHLGQHHCQAAWLTCELERFIVTPALPFEPRSRKPIGENYRTRNLHVIWPTRTCRKATREQDAWFEYDLKRKIEAN